MNQNQYPQFPHDSWDQNTMLSNLPDSNNVFPQVQEGPGINPGTSRIVASHLRAKWQSALGKSPLHNVAYNMMAHNGFNNPEFTHAVHYATNFISFLITVQNEDPNSAFNKALSHIYKGYIAIALTRQPYLAQMLNQGPLQEAQNSGVLLASLIRDVDTFMNGLQQQQPMQNNMGYQQPMNNNMGYQQPMNNNMGYQSPINNSVGAGYQPRTNNHVIGGNSAVAAATQGGNNQQRPVQQTVSNGPRSFQHTQQNTNSAAPQTGVIASIYDHTTKNNNQGVIPPQGSTVQEWGTDTGVVNNNQQGSNPMNPATEQSFHDLDRDDIPLEMEDIIFDPYNYIPPGVEIDDNEPYNVIYVPGGGRLEISFKSELKPTKNDIAAYPNAIQPDLFCKYYYQHPGGFVSEYITEWRDDMEYAKHQLIAELRGTDEKADGIMTTSSRLLAVTKEPPTTIQLLKSKYGDDIAETRILERPIFIEGVMIGSSRIEEEEVARQTLVDELKWWDETENLPAHIYMSETLHPLDLQGEAVDRLFALMTALTLEGLIRGLKELIRDDLLPLRTFRLINDRLTESLNRALHDNLSIDKSDITITNFSNDYEELLNILRTEPEYEGMAEVLEPKAEKIIMDAMTLRLVPKVEEEATEEESEESEDNLFIVDQRINYRVGFELSELVNITTIDEAHLVSRANSPNLATLVDKYVAFARVEKKLPGRVYIITSDGVYLEVLIGWLGSNNLLIKRLK